MQTITDFIWRVRCAYHFGRRLGWGWVTHWWGLAGTSLESEQDTRRRYGDALPSPADAVDEELSCWSE
jgi:hypothetical protein